MHAIEVRVGGERLSLVLRRMTREPWRAHARELLEREAAVLRMLAPRAIPVARLVGLDASAAMLLMTRLPGRLRLETGPEVVGALARTLVSIHRFVPPSGRARTTTGRIRSAGWYRRGPAAAMYGTGRSRESPATRQRCSPLSCIVTFMRGTSSSWVRR